nr:MAG TPA: hypothetical protein [Bacteriophage sp.]
MKKQFRSYYIIQKVSYLVKELLKSLLKILLFHLVQIHYHYQMALQQ